MRVKVRTLEQKKKVKKPKEEEWVPTQEELLEEAKITEQENLASLGECFCIQFCCFIKFVIFFSKKNIKKWKVKRRINVQ